LSSSVDDSYSDRETEEIIAKSKSLVASVEAGSAAAVAAAA